MKRTNPVNIALLVLILVNIIFTILNNNIVALLGWTSAFILLCEVLYLLKINIGYITYEDRKIHCWRLRSLNRR